MATAATTTTATVALTTTWDNATGQPTVSEGIGMGRMGGVEPSESTATSPVPLPQQAEPEDPVLDNYVLLVVVTALFVGGTLVVLSGALLLCKRCWEVHRRLHRCARRLPAVGGDPAGLEQVSMRACPGCT